MSSKESKKRKRDDSQLVAKYTEPPGPHAILLNTPGIVAPTDITFQAYTKKSDRILHTSSHPRLDYTAHPTPDPHLKHYMVLHNPKTLTTQIRPIEKLTLRAHTRKASLPTAITRNPKSQREALGLEFGTKKAQKALLDKSRNAITSTAPQPEILASLDELDPPPNQAEIQLNAKPIPKPNPAATRVEDAYPFGELIPPQVAKQLSTEKWVKSVHGGEEIKFHHRYPAKHVVAVVRSGDDERLLALRYLHLLLSFHDTLTGRMPKKIPKREVLLKKLGEEFSPQAIEGVRNRFAVGGELPKWNFEKLRIWICALALRAEGFVVWTGELRDDLRVSDEEITKFFRELGCKVAAPTLKELGEVGLSKAQGLGMRVARLRVPLVFPKSGGKRRGGK
ncbi:hypothetical protein K470DRAFT_256479 [Piedraia hortae CBS 480.64]|uniref:RNA polymerase I associated factor, A49-like protein n=1 Tax=Piedraia hortae CBS 480.64 TaxID=1314780 RepID=A0A6A7C3L0_9PEZI|nr:hypothetical protein K470DRAFT_256479 [Piedraia hortae CBS 480.64]